jgi:hypothetical protein
MNLTPPKTKTTTIMAVTTVVTGFESLRNRWPRAQP